MQIKYIYWFAHYNLNGPCVRYRGIYALELVKKKYDIDFAFVYPGYKPGNIIRFIKVYFSALLFRKKNSIIVFQKIHTNGIYSLVLRILLFFRRNRTLYDLDDAYHLIFPDKIIKYFIAKCQKCSVGSKELGGFAQKLNPNVFLLTSPVISHNKMKFSRNKVFTVGWIGFYNAHKVNLEQLFFPAIRNLDFTLKLILLGVTKEDHMKEIIEYFSMQKNIQLDIPVSINWLDELYVYDRIKEFDVGISPLIDNAINRSKSAFKLKQYLSCGIPVLASPVGENNRFIKDGLNGYICQAPVDFRNKIINIRNLDNEKYRTLCFNAKNSLREFNMELYCNIMISIFNEPLATS